MSILSAAFRRLAPLACLAALLALPQGALAEAEVHVIAIEGPAGIPAPGLLPTVPVALDRPGAEVKLLLGSEQPVRWVITTNGATLTRVVFFGEAARAARMRVDGKEPASREVARGLPWPAEDGPALRAFEIALAEPDGFGRATSLALAEAPPDAGFVIGRADPSDPLGRTAPPVPDPTVVPSVLAEALAWNGPDPAPRVAFTPEGFFTFGEDRAWTRHPLPPGLPEISWPMGATADPAGFLYGVTLGGVGYLYRYDTRTDTWAMLGDMANEDASGLVYDAGSDRLVIVASAFGGSPAVLLQDLATGARRKVALGWRQFPGLSDVAGAAGWRKIVFQPVAIDGDALLLWTDGDRHRGQEPPRPVWLTYLLDLSTGKATLVAQSGPSQD